MDKTKINSSTDWLLDSCYSHCFVCGTPFLSPPVLDSNGNLEGMALYFYIIDECGDKVENDERICDNCLVNGDLSQFGNGE